MSPVKISPFAEKGWHDLYISFKAAYHFQASKEILAAHPKADAELLDFLVWWFRESQLEFLDKKVMELDLTYREAICEPQGILQLRAIF